MKLNIVIGNVVLDLDTRRSRVVIVKLPGGDRAVGLNSAFDVDHARGPKVSPGEFFFARPDQLHRLAGAARETRGLDRVLAGVLATVSGTGVGDNNANFVFRDVECL